MKKVVSATLAGALAVGMVPAMALADDAIELQAGEQAELANGTISATEVVAAGNYKITVPTEVKTYTGATIVLEGNAAYERVIYKVSNAAGAESVTGVQHDYMEDDEWIVASAVYTEATAATFVDGPGTYYVAVRVANNHDGDDYLAVKTSVAAHILDGAYLYEEVGTATDVEDTVFTYTGSPIDVCLTFGVNGDLKKGTGSTDDYNLTFAKKAADGKYYTAGVTQVVEAGEYAAIVDGNGKYEGYANTLYFTVGKLDLSRATLTLEESGSDLTYKVASSTELANSINHEDLEVNGTFLGDDVVVSYSGSFPDSTILAKGVHTYTVAPKLKADGSQENPSITGTDTIQVVRYAKAANISFGDQGANAVGVAFDPAKIKVAKSAAADAETVAYKLTYLKKDEKAAGEKWDEVSGFTAPGIYKAIVTVDDSTYTYGGKSTHQFTVNPVALNGSANVYLTYNGVNDADGALADVYYNGTDFLKKVAVSVLDSKGNKLVEGTDYVVAVTAQVKGATKVFTEIVDANDYTITVKAAEGSKYEISNAAWTIKVKQAEVTPVILNGVKVQNGKYANYDALWTGEAIQPVTGFTVADNLGANGVDADSDPDALEVPAGNYNVVITSYVDKKNVAATPSTMPTEFVNPGVYKFKIVPAEDNVNFDFQNAAEINAAGEYTFEIVNDNVFADVKAGAWYADEVYAVAKANIMGGYGNHMFGPNDGMKRGDVALALGRALGMATDMAFTGNGTTNTVVKVVTGFEDVDGGAYYARAIKSMADAGIMTGYADGTYGPNELVTREQLATILCRIEESGLGDASILASVLDAYADADEVSKFAVESMEWAVENGIMGVDTKFLNPTDAVTRAEVAAMLVRFDAKFDAFAAL